jgi:predicted ATPase
MIDQIHIENFKSHKDTTLQLGNLTLLCGQNGVGKSSIIQSLLLLRQTFQKNRLQEGLELNKPICEIGNAQDALHQYAQKYHLGISLEFSRNQIFSWKFEFKDAKSNATFLDILSFEGDISILKGYSLFNRYFQYLSAARLAPRESYPKDDYEVEKNRQISIEKGQGELIAHFLHHYSNGKEAIEVNEALRNNHSSFKDLLSQTTAWEREISKNVNVKVIDLGKGFEIKYNFDVDGGFPTNDFRAENVGFGVTYTLPIIVAILAAQEDDLIIIENPEAHLHPYGQAKLTELMCRAAQAGIQIIVETHSDHIINGCLVACKKGTIKRENLKIWYFDRDETQHASRATEVEVLEGGRIVYPPQGFFDQISKDRKILMGF